MRICLITEYYHPEYKGGVPTVLSHLTRYLKDHYPEVALDVITSRNYYRSTGPLLAKSENWDGIRITRLSTPKSNHPSTAIRLLLGAVFSLAALCRLLVRPRYDLIWVGTNPPASPLAAKGYRRLRGVPYLYLVHDLYPDLPVKQCMFSESHIAVRIAHALQQGWLHAARRIVALGRCNREYLARQYNVSREQITVITNWADTEQIVPIPVDASQFRQTHGLTGFLVIYAGNLGRLQGLGQILEAAKQLQHDPEITMVLVGSGDCAEELNDRVSREDLHNVRIFPAVPPEAYPDLLAAANVGLVPLAPNHDGLALPSKFYSVLASARPVIAIVEEQSEFAHVLTEADCGLRVDHDAPAQLAAAVLSLKAAPERCARMGAHARQVVETLYILPNIAQQFYDAFTATANPPSTDQQRD